MFPVLTRGWTYYIAPPLTFTADISNRNWDVPFYNPNKPANPTTWEATF